MEVHPDLIRKELKEWTVSTVLSLNKKDFSNKLSSALDGVKRGHASKLWFPLLAFIQDENTKVPDHILIQNEKTQIEDDDDSKQEML